MLSAVLLFLISIQSSFAQESNQLETFDIVAAKQSLANKHLDLLNTNLTEEQKKREYTKYRRH